MVPFVDFAPSSSNPMEELSSLWVSRAPQQYKYGNFRLDITCRILNEFFSSSCSIWNLSVRLLQANYFYRITENNFRINYEEGLLSPMGWTIFGFATQIWDDHFQLLYLRDFGRPFLKGLLLRETPSHLLPLIQWKDYPVYRFLMLLPT
ncbi:hypothetical protein CEXT_552931 [Caerostris extrusa]|uniref:Uncharacterized protein n=1 Tax=Caerostris extrusa TaxID=172846 RepID=A0AAV4VQQ9_CAEEX|nr:hypothetical protein CEXT_552931 [Caerostris extrusa]